MHSLPERLSTLCAITPQSNIEHVEKEFCKILDPFIYGNGYRLEGVNHRYGCFEPFRRTKTKGSIFIFTNGLYPEFITDVVDELNNTFPNFHIEAKKHSNVGIHTEVDRFRDKKYYSLSSKEETETVPCYYFKVTINPIYDKHKIMIWYLIHNLIRLFSCQESGICRFKRSRSTNDVNTYYKENGLWATIKKLNSTAQNPRQLYEKELNETLIKQIFDIGYWFDDVESIVGTFGYYSQTSVIDKIRAIIKPDNIYDLREQPKFIKGRPNCEFNITGSDMTKGKIIELHTRYVCIEILEHNTIKSVIGKQAIVPHDSIFPYHLEDNNSKFPYKYIGLNNV